MSEDNLNGNVTYPYEVGVDVHPEKAKETYQKLKETIIKTFSNTKLTEEGEIGEEDITAIYKFYEAAAKINPEVFNLSIQEHLLFTERYAQLLGEMYNNSVSEKKSVDINMLRAGALLHDLGRTFSHRRARNDRIEEMLLSASGVRGDIKNTIPPDSKFVFSENRGSSGKNIESIDDLTDPPYPALVVMADVLAKKIKDNGQVRLRRWEDVVSATKSRQKTPGKASMWPSEYARQRKVFGTYEYVGRLYDNVGSWFEETTGLNLNAVVDEMEKSLQDNPLIVDWGISSKTKDFLSSPHKGGQIGTSF